MSDHADQVNPTPDRTGKFLGIPYDWRRPTWKRFKQRWWNPNDRHLITPKAYGWGFDLNLYELAARLHLVKRTDNGGTAAS